MEGSKEKASSHIQSKVGVAAEKTPQINKTARSRGSKRAGTVPRTQTARSTNQERRGKAKTVPINVGDISRMSRRDLKRLDISSLSRDEIRNYL